MKKVGFGIIGCGGISNLFHIPELEEIDEADIVAVTDLNSERARITAERFGIKTWYTDYLEMLRRDDIDAVIVATPHPTHARITVDALEAGKHVLIQKPMCTDVKDADAILDAAKRNSHLKVMVLPFIYFDTPAFNYVKELIENGDLGRICIVRVRYAHGGPEGYQMKVAQMFNEETSCWFFDQEKAHGGVILDLGVYAVTQLIQLLGRVEEVSAFTATLSKPTALEDNAVMILKMRDGSLATVETSWTQTSSLEGTAIYGTEGTAYINFFEKNVMVRRCVDSNWRSPNLAVEKEPQHTHRYFVKCIMEDLEPIGTVEKGRHVIEVLEAAYESARTGKVIRLG